MKHNYIIFNWNVISLLNLYYFRSQQTMVSAIKPLDDNDLTNLLKDGDESAFTEIYNRYWDKLYFIAYKLLKDTASAEEIVQEVFLSLWKKRDTLIIQSLPQYLAAMARYAVYRHCAKEKQLKENENALGLLKAGDIAEIDIGKFEVFC